MHFATNHFAHFALATGLHRALAAAGGTRVVSVVRLRAAPRGGRVFSRVLHWLASSDREKVASLN